MKEPDIQGDTGLASDETGRTGEKETKPRGKRAPRASDNHVANALRSAYQEAVREEVPDEFLDLLGKLS